jgi:hypothetical protein
MKLGVHFLLVAALVSAGAALAQESNVAHNHATSCGFAQAQSEMQGTHMIPGDARMLCGGRSNAQIDAKLLSNCQGCTVVEHFTHACGAYSATASNNMSNTASGYAVVQFADADSNAAMVEASRQANEKCTSKGGHDCYVRLNVCDFGNYSPETRPSGAAVR